MVLFLSLGIFGPVMAHIPDSTKTSGAPRVKFVFYPAAGYSPETSFELGAVGAFLLNSGHDSAKIPLRPATMVPHFLFTWNGQFMSAVKSDIYFKTGYYINFNIRYFDYPDQFFGIGSNTSSSKESFTDRFFRIDGKLARAYHKKTFLGINFDWSADHLDDFRDGGILDTGNIAGTEGGYIFGIGPSVRFDTRDNILYPTRGIMAEANILAYPGNLTSGYSFTSLKVEGKYFTKVFSDNILAIQAVFQLTSGNKIPFYRLPRLGGDTRMRGIEHENRYIDRNAYYLQVEGRRDLFWRLGGVLFAAAGNVNSRLSEFGFRDIKYVFGIGGRFRPFKNDRLNLRMDIGKGPGDQYGIYLGVGEAF
ncbi:MAG TPA: BamA/TamA family outer membrane protein [Cyclobacteriaceae bacterium]|nr:BamA/TamA family outer membrane protein [Cyclobacteriaceae bacterium]